MNSYDSHGWLSLAEIAGRTTGVSPPAHGAVPVVGQPWPNFTGVEWVMVAYSEPVIPAPAAPTYGSKITTDALYRRMTAAERRRIELASIDPGVAGAARNLAADLRVAKTRLSGAAYFDLELPENITEVGNLGLAGLLDPPQHGGVTRAAELLSSPVTDQNELPGSVRVAYGMPEIPA